MTKPQEDEGINIESYWKTYTGYIETLTKWYQKQSGPLQRFIKYGGWIFIQFWVIRAPMTIFFTNSFTETIKINLFIHILEIPGYLLASFTSGTLLAIVGFILSEKWIWRIKKAEV